MLSLSPRRPACPELDRASPTPSPPACFGWTREAEKNASLAHRRAGEFYFYSF